MDFIKNKNYSFSILILVSPVLYARGGPGGAIAEAFLFFLQIFIVIGIISGIFFGTVYKNKKIALSKIFYIGLICLILLISIIIFSPILAIFYSPPFILGLYFFYISSDITKKGLFNHSIRPNPYNQKISHTLSSKFLQFFNLSYVFWVLVSFININLLNFLIFPNFIFSSETINKLMPFLQFPLITSLIFSSIVSVLIILTFWKKKFNGYLISFFFNLTFLISFFISADLYKEHLMEKDLKNYQPENLYKVSFFKSVVNHSYYWGYGHARFNEGEKVYDWSYSEKKFYRRK